MGNIELWQNHHFCSHDSAAIGVPALVVHSLLFFIVFHFVFFFVCKPLKFVRIFELNTLGTLYASTAFPDLLITLDVDFLLAEHPLRLSLQPSLPFYRFLRFKNGPCFVAMGKFVLYHLNGRPLLWLSKRHESKNILYINIP